MAEPRSSSAEERLCRALQGDVEELPARVALAYAGKGGWRDRDEAKKKRKKR